MGFSYVLCILSLSITLQEILQTKNNKGEKYRIKKADKAAERLNQSYKCNQGFLFFLLYYSLYFFVLYINS